MTAEPVGREWTADEQKVKSYLRRADEFPHRTEGEAVLLDLVPAGAARVLDLGTGDGRLLARLQIGRPDMAGVGLDFSEIMLREARKRFEGDNGIEIIRHDLGTALPPLGFFDAVVSSFAIHHLEDKRKRVLYREVFDILNPDGVWLTLVPRTRVPSRSKQEREAQGGDRGGGGRARPPLRLP